MEEYNPTTHVSVPKPSPQQLRNRHDAVMLASGLVLVGGGASTLLELYDPQTSTWSAGPSLPQSRQFFPKLTLLASGNVLITGGNANITSTELYQPGTNTIAAGPAMPVPFKEHQVHVVGSNKIFVAYRGQSAEASTPFTVDLTTGGIQYFPLMATHLPSAYQAGRVVIAHELASHFVFLDLTSTRLLGNRWQYVWKVTRDQVTQYLQDFANNTVNFNHYPDIETWPGNGNVTFGEDPQLAPYIDVDQDGFYDPVHDGDYPCFPGDQGLWWVFNDDGIHQGSLGNSFPVQVEAMAYAFDCDHYPCPDTALDYATFYHYEITNRSNHAYHDVFLGNFSDLDVGNPDDDYLGSDSALSLAYAYNADLVDEGPFGYGSNPPAVGYLCLPNGEIDAMSGFHYYRNDFGAMGNPAAPEDYYNYLNSRMLDSTHLVNNGLNGYSGTASGTPTNYAFPGDPGYCGPTTGDLRWNEVAAANPLADRRALQIFGPHNLDASASIHLDFGILYARANTNDNLGSVCKLKADAATIKSWWTTNLDKSCFSIVTKLEEPQAAWAPKIVPNPNAGLFDVELGSATETDLQLELLNLQGQVVLRQTLHAGEARVRMDASNLPKGVYCLRTVGVDAFKVQKVAIH
jgi:hypothetical protein